MASARVICVALFLCAAALQAADNSPWLRIGKAEVHPTRILARFESGRSPADAEVAPLLAELGLTIRREYKLVPGLVVFDEATRPLAPMAAVVPVDPDEARARVLRERIARLRDSGLFRYVEPSPVRRPTGHTADDGAYTDGTLWGLQNVGLLGGVVGADVNATKAWEISTGSTNVIVAVNDTGIRYTHQDLASQMWRNAGEIPNNGKDDDGNGYVDDVFGVDIMVGSGDPMDFDDHGTHVAGTIGAAANNGFPMVGVAWQLRLMAVRWLSTLGGTTDDAIAAMEYAVGNGAHVVNGSYGGYLFSTSEYDSIVAAMKSGVLFVVAAGNDSLDNDGDFNHYPSSYDAPNIVAVAALNRADLMADFSNFGKTSVDIGAPGVEIFSSFSTANNAYSTISGTSMASPHVAGVAALVAAHYPNSSLTERRERLLRTVVPVNSLAGMITTGGRVDAYKALSATPDGELEVVVTPPSGSVLLGGSQQTVLVEVSDMFSVTGATVTGLTNASGASLTFVDTGAAPDAVANDGIYSANIAVPAGVTSLTLEITVQAPEKITKVVMVEYEVQPPPPNDNFVNASKIPAAGTRLNSNSQLATIEPGEPMHAGVATVAATLWWNWSPSANNRALVDTSGSAFDTVVAVYTGTDIRDLKRIAAADDVNNRRQAYVTFDAVAGVTYHIVIGGADPAQRGSIQLRVQPNGLPDVTGPSVVIETPTGLLTTERDLVVKGSALDPEPNASGVRQVLIQVNDELTGRSAQGTTNWLAPLALQVGRNIVRATAVDGAGNQGQTRQIQVTYMPQDPANDHFVNSALLSEEAGAASWSNVNATKESGEPLHGGNAGGKSVWGRWVAPGDGSLTVDTLGSGFDTLLGVYTGDRVGSLTEVGANDDAPSGSTNSLITLSVHSNMTYHFAVDGYSGASGDIHFNYRFTAGPLYHVSLAAGAGGTVSPSTGDYSGAIPLTITATADPGFSFVGWTGDMESAVNPLEFVPDRDLAITANFQRRTFTEDFETGGFSPVLHYDLSPAGSAAAWIVQTNTVDFGKHAAQAGTIEHGQHSSLRLTEVLDAGIGSFYLKVSSEASWDGLEFYLNDVRLQRWSGEQPWQLFEFSVPAGTNTLEWRYSKDFTIKAGADTAYLDNLMLPLASGEQGAALLKLTYIPQTAQLELRGLPDRLYFLQASPDLRSWQTISTNLAVNGVIRISDPTMGMGAGRFYRAVKP